MHLILYDATETMKTCKNPGMDFIKMTWLPSISFAHVVNYMYFDFPNSTDYEVITNYKGLPTHILLNSKHPENMLPMIRVLRILSSSVNMSLVDTVTKLSDSVVCDLNLLQSLVTGNQTCANDYCGFVQTTRFADMQIAYCSHHFIHLTSKAIRLLLDRANIHNEVKGPEELVISIVLMLGGITPKSDARISITTHQTKFINDPNIMMLEKSDEIIEDETLWSSFPKDISNDVKYFDTEKGTVIFYLQPGSFGNLLSQCLFCYEMCIASDVNLVVNKQYRDIQNKNVSEYGLLSHVNFCNLDYINALNCQELEKQNNESLARIKFDNSLNWIIQGGYSDLTSISDETAELFKAHMWMQNKDLFIQAKLYVDQLRTEFYQKQAIVMMEFDSDMDVSCQLPAFYKNAINALRSKNALFLVFTNNREMLLQQDWFDDECMVVYKIDDHKNELAFLCMTYCDHFVLSGSNLSTCAYILRNRTKQQSIAIISETHA